MKVNNFRVAFSIMYQTMSASVHQDHIRRVCSPVGFLYQYNWEICHRLTSSIVYKCYNIFTLMMIVNLGSISFI